MEHTLTLRPVMVADLVVSGAFTLPMVLAAGPLGERLSIEPVVLRAVGALLVVHVALLAWSVATDHVELGARYAVVANLGWVVGAVAVLIGGWLAPIAAGLLAAVSLVVGAFAVLQWRGLHMPGLARTSA